MRLCLSLWLIQDSNWKGRVLWKLSGGLATIFQNWISWNEQKMREAHITRRGTSFYLLIFIEKIINRKIEHSQPKNALTVDPAKWKTGKKLYFSSHWGDETTTYYNRAYGKPPAGPGAMWEEASGSRIGKGARGRRWLRFPRARPWAGRQQRRRNGPGHRLRRFRCIHRSQPENQPYPR